MNALESLQWAAQKLARRKGISFSEAYRRILIANPQAYEQAMREKADCSVGGTSRAKRYTQLVGLLAETR